MYNELARREVKSDHPLHVTVEHNTCWNLTIIDTPGLTGNADHDEATLNLCKVPNRLVVCVEKAMDWESTITGRFSRQFDPKGDRTIFVTSHFSSFIKSCPGTKELNAWLSKSVAATALDKVHFVTMAGGNIDALFKADMELLEQMQYVIAFFVLFALFRSALSYVCVLSCKDTICDTNVRSVSKTREKRCSIQRCANGRQVAENAIVFQC